MKKFSFLSCVFLLLSLLTTRSLIAEDALVFVLDSGWKIGYKAADGQAKLLEFVTSGESIDNWTRLCTINQYRRPANKEITAQDFAENFREGLKTQVKGVDWNVLESTPQSVIIWWSINASPKHAAQHELMRVIVTDTTIYRLAFTIKSETMPPDLCGQWTSTLQNASIETKGQSSTDAAE